MFEFTGTQIPTFPHFRVKEVHKDHARLHNTSRHGSLFVGFSKRMKGERAALP
jgi:hypothetical protein